jgi:uncharacterized protein
MTDQPPYQDRLHPVTLDVRGSAQQEVPADSAVVQVSVQGRANDQRGAAAAAEADLNELRAAISHADGVEEVSLSGLSVTEERAWDDTTRTHVPVGWIGRVSGSVRVKADAASDAIGSLFGTRARVDYVQWTIKPDNPAYRQVRAAAVADAFRAAADFAAAIDRPLGPLVSLADPGTGPVGPPAARAHSPVAAMADAEQPTIDLDPAHITISAEVHAQFLTE